MKLELLGDKHPRGITWALWLNEQILVGKGFARTQKAAKKAADKAFSNFKAGIKPLKTPDWVEWA